MNSNLYAGLLTVVTLLQLIELSKGSPIWLDEQPEYPSDNSWTPQSEYKIKSWNGVRQQADLCPGGLCTEQDETLDQVDVPGKREMFISRGWGAGGMPFNVLYMNPKPEVRKSPRSLILAEPLRSQNRPGIFDNTNGAAAGNSAVLPPSPPETSVRSSGGVGTRQQHRARVGQNGGILPPRRHYSIIPQLFVSYGWGPIGK